MATYLAYRYGKMTQSFVMKTENYETLYDACIVKFKLFGDSDFEFINAQTGEKTPHKISKVKTVNQGSLGFNATTSSYFKLDGVNIFDVLNKKGYYFKTVLKLDLIHPELTLLDASGKEVAHFKMNVKGPRQENVPGIGNTQRNTVITTDSKDLEGVFLAALALSRVDFNTSLL